MSLTTNPNDPCLHEGQKSEGQNECYLVLSEEERAKGFIRPVRNTYVHVGRLPLYKSFYRFLTDEEKSEYKDKQYVAIMTVITNEDGSHAGGPYITQDELDAWEKNKRIGGCGVATTMGTALAETYARDPKFYGATFCTGCNKHISVDEFFWDGTNETVGS